jgi:histidinol-phosphate phosphatase family protein
MQPAVFLDKDGTLIENVPYNVDRARIKLMPHAGVALRKLHPLGYALVVVSNQSGVAQGMFDIGALRNVENKLRELLAGEGVPLAGFYFCPHAPGGTVSQYAIACACRKPQPGMLQQAACDLDLDLARSWMLGDILDDVEAGRRAGCRSILVDSGGETEWLLTSSWRRPEFVAGDLSLAAQHVALHTQLTLCS